MMMFLELLVLYGFLGFGDLTESYISIGVVVFFLCFLYRLVVFVFVSPSWFTIFGDDHSTQKGTCAD